MLSLFHFFRPFQVSRGYKASNGFNCGSYIGMTLKLRGLRLAEIHFPRMPSFNAIIGAIELSTSQL